MANTVCKFPFLPTPSGSYTVDVVDPSDLSTLESAIALTLNSGVYEGTVTGSHAGRLAFVVKDGATIKEHRVRTIEDTIGPFTIVTGLDGIGLATLPANPSDDDLLCTGYGITYSVAGVRTNGIDISLKMVIAPTNGGLSIASGTRTATSADTVIDSETVTGYYEFEKLVRGATYEIWVGDGTESTPVSPFGARTSNRTRFVVDDAPTMALASVFGEVAA